jgi:hypothetical protein
MVVVFVVNERDRTRRSDHQLTLTSVDIFFDLQPHQLSPTL